MIICHCRQVTDRKLRAAVRAGARTAEQLAEICGAGACCGGCGPAVKQIVDEESRPSRTSLPLLASL